MKVNLINAWNADMKARKEKEKCLKEKTLKRGLTDMLMVL